MLKKVLMMAVAGLAAMLLMASGTMADTFGTGGNQFTIDFVGISDNTNPASGYGIVNNDYRMGTLEITNAQWDKFKVAYGTVTGSPAEGWFKQNRAPMAGKSPLLTRRKCLSLSRNVIQSLTRPMVTMGQSLYGKCQ